MLDLGFAFHPDYGNSGLFYVNYTRRSDGATVVARYSVSAGPNRADPASGSPILTVAQPYSNHNGGQILFGPDGYLYVGMGDGGSGGDPLNNGQNESTLLRPLMMNGSTDGPDKIALVRVTNESGHKLPTGYPEGRRLWINLRGYDRDGVLIYESGAYDPASGFLSEDADIKIYEAKQGITPELAAQLNQLPGESFHFVLNNTVIKDNRVPPRGYTQAAFDRPGLRPVGATYADGQYWDDTVYTVPPETERVMVTLYYQTASKEYIDFLRTNGGIDGAALGSMWDTSKSHLKP